MAKLTLQIIGNTDDVKRKIQIVREELSKIEQHPIKIGVQASGLDAVAAKLKEIADQDYRAVEAAAKLANAEARKINAETKAAAAADRLAKAQRDQASAAQNAAQANERVALSNEQIQQKMLNAAKQTDYLRGKNTELYNQYLSIKRISGEVASGQQQTANSMALVIRNAGTLQAQVRGLAEAYGQLARAGMGFGGGSGAINMGGSQQRFLPESNINWDYYQRRTTVDYGRAIDVEWRDVTDGAAQATGAVNAAASAAGRATSSFNTMREGMGAAWARMKEGTPIADALGDSIGNIIVKITTWQVVNGVVASIKRAFKDALDTMKEVDQQLTNIQKVSELSVEQIARIGESAYDTASKYGVAAEEYLSAVYTFQKAGLGASAEQMGELAVKTMLVGDTTADVATKFIIASNAAWKYGGSVEQLSRLVDEADKLNNTYAVSLSDIAEGLPIVAATAAQTGMTAEQTMAAISTIVASTGQSATKAATALRAILMNLIGETGEFEEGIVVTEETVKTLNVVLNEYAGEALKAAEAEGKILDPMTAIAAVAQAVTDGFLNQAEAFELMSGLGGKLRTTQLVALVNAQDMYNSMLADTADAAGTADREISIMLESWNSKTQILTNTFTQFISHLVDSKGIKAGIDALTGLVRILDSGIGKTATLTAAFLAMGKIIAQIGRGKVFQFLLNEIMGLVAGTVTATTAVADLWAILSTSPLFWAAAAAAIFMGINAAVDALTTSYQEQKEILDDIQRNYDQLYGVGSEYDNLINKVNDLTDAEKERLAVLEMEAQAERDRLNAQKEAVFLEWRKDRAEAGTTTTMSPTQGSQFAFKIEKTDLNAEQVRETSAALSELVDLYEAGNYTATGYKEKVQQLALTLKDSAEEIKRGKEAGVELTASEQALLDIYTQMLGILTGLTGAVKTDTEAKKENAESTNDAAEANETLQKAFEEVDKKGSLTYGTLAELDKLYPGLSAKILDANGNLTAEGQAALSTRAALYELISSMITANTTALNFDSQIAALQQLASEAGIAAGSISAVFAAANMGAAGTGDWDDISNMTPDQLARYRASTASNQTMALLRKQIHDQETITTSGGGGGGGGGSKAKTEEELLAEAQQAEINRLKAIVDLRKQELSFLQASGASEQTQIDKQREIQAALHEQAEYLRSIDADEKDILALSTEWWNIENKINETTENIAKKLREDIADALQDIGDRLENAADALTNPLQAELDAMESARDAAEERRKEEEKIAAVKEKQIELEKARIALENAQRERTVRQYNAAAGRWEWVANSKNVEAAQENLINAQKNLVDAQNDLAKYYADQAYETQKAVLNKQIKATKEAFAAFRDRIKEAADAVKNGEMSFDEAYDYIADAMKDIYDQYGIDLTDVLKDAISGMDDVTGAIGQLLQKILAMLNSAGDKKQDSGAGGGSGLAGSVVSSTNANGETYNVGTKLGQDFINYAASGADMIGGDGSRWVKNADGTTTVTTNSGKSFVYSGTGTGGGLSDQTYSSTNASGQTYNVGSALGQDFIDHAAPGATMTGGDGSQWTKNADGSTTIKTSNGNTFSFFDSGGILHGVGGIKATREDEMVLDPHMTKRLLESERNGAFDALMHHLNIVTAAANNVAGYGGAVTRSSIGAQYFGGIVNINGIELRNVTGNTTLGELTRMAKNLALAKGS